MEQADLKMSYSKEAGLMIGGDLQIKKGTPGIGGGTIHAQVTKKPGAGDYVVKASGHATPTIAGISSQLNVTYDDGMFDANITAAYEKGMLKGSVTVGATNRPVGDDGKPAGEAPPKADKISIYGGGTVSLKLAPWLQATAGIMLKPNGEVVVTGRIGLPSAIDLFPEKKFDKNIFKIGIDIPIVGVSVAGQHIGIFANITGGLDLAAGVGPGQLQDLALEVTYNPSNESETHVVGDAKLHIPANAGLRLFVQGIVWSVESPSLTLRQASRWVACWAFRVRWTPAFTSTGPRRRVWSSIPSRRSMPSLYSNSTSRGLSLLRPICLLPRSSSTARSGNWRLLNMDPVCASDSSCRFITKKVSRSTHR